MQTTVFKFGGASVKDAAGVRNVAKILSRFPETNILVVVSAMGKTTNALEELLRHYLAVDAIAVTETFARILSYHVTILGELIPDADDPIHGELRSHFEHLRGYIRKGHTVKGEMRDYDFEYDQVVSYGELFSATILHYYLLRQGYDCRLFDARGLIKTDSTHREAKVNWELTTNLIREKAGSFLSSKKGRARIALTQGFIGSNEKNDAVTLGREGSDYTAAICAWALKTEEVTIWKDVSGVMNADPKWFPRPVRLNKLSFREVIELAYYGASVIHPKTIKPLENAGIRLRVKSFLDPDGDGTVIENLSNWEVPVPIYIRKENQVLVSLSPRDFSFIVEENLGQIFTILANHRAKVNVMQNSAISFSLCLDRNDHSLEGLISELSRNYEVRYNYNVELYTIRHYTPRAIRKVTKEKQVLLEQKTRSTVHLVLS
jgi:aspartate kinase